jgi:hypothetical protein
VVDYQGGVLTLLFQSASDVENFKQSGNAAESLRQQIFELMGVRVKYKARIAEQVSAQETKPASNTKSDSKKPAAPTQQSTSDEELTQESTESEPQPESANTANETSDDSDANEDASQSAGDENTSEKLGESVLRDVLGAKPVDKD